MGLAAATAVRVLKAIYGILAASGRMYVWMPLADLHPDRSDVPSHHPERLRPDLPLTDYERALEHELTTESRLP
ncbi:hypothetical protein M878_25045 [Streptomyces roseochromogenus subsp. oscitans DS 12.976]|uniref:Uncharacterized protein n=2 Tax=Streptomyces roseochromogenus TaxID=285450 RepID=V6K5E8_STRRC|nr:hypothetical protein M878_25045 [Streptomyces roseochromogenus subsp. oscitans DS 12.976]